MTTVAAVADLVVFIRAFMALSLRNNDSETTRRRHEDTADDAANDDSAPESQAKPRFC